MSKNRIFLKDQCTNLEGKRVPKDRHNYPKPVNKGSRFCEWIYREGTRPNLHFAFTPCKPGFNFIGKTENLQSVLNKYVERKISCPICGKTIHIISNNII